MTIHERDLATANAAIADMSRRKDLTALEQRQLDFFKNERRKILSEMKADGETKKEERK